MRILSQSTLRTFWLKHANAELPLKAWYMETSKANWQSPHDIKASHANASIIDNERVVFNIKGNDYRLIVAINYKAQFVFVKFIGTHSEYDRIDAASVELK